MRKAVATQAGVERAVQELTAEGLGPTVDRVRTKLGGGSFSTIGRLLSDVLADRNVDSTPASEIPAAVMDIGQRAIASIYAAANRAAIARIDVIETEARKHVDAANHARSETTLEIERLEQEAEAHAESIAAAQKEAKDYQRRAEVAESRVQAYEATERDLRFEIRDVQKELALAEALANSAQQELKTARDELAAARTAERNARDESAELRGQLKAKR